MIKKRNDIKLKEITENPIKIEFNGTINKNTVLLNSEDNNSVDKLTVLMGLIGCYNNILNQIDMSHDEFVEFYDTVIDIQI